MYFVTVNSSGNVTDVYSDENKNVPSDAIAITNDEFKTMNEHQAGFSGFVRDGASIVASQDRIDDIEAAAIREKLIEAERKRFIENGISTKTAQINGMSLQQLRAERGKL